MQSSSSEPSFSSSTGISRPQDFREQVPFDTCMLWTIQFISVESSPLYEITRSFSWKSPGAAGWSYAHSQVLVCPKCLRQWAHLAFQELSRTDVEHHCLWPTAAFCSNCEVESERAPPGSILLDYGWGIGNIDLPLLWALPEELLKREFMIHLNYFEKEFRDA